MNAQVELYGETPLKEVVPAIVTSVKAPKGMSLARFCREHMGRWPAISPGWYQTPQNFHKIGKRNHIPVSELTTMLEIAHVVGVTVMLKPTPTAPSLTLHAGNLANFIADPEAEILRARSRTQAGWAGFAAAFGAQCCGHKI